MFRFTWKRVRQCFLCFLALLSVANLRKLRQSLNEHRLILQGQYSSVVNNRSSIGVARQNSLSTLKAIGSGRGGKYLLVFAGHGGQAQRRDILLANMRHIHKSRHILDCIVFTYRPKTGVEELVYPCHIVHRENWTWSAFIQLITPQLVRSSKYDGVIVTFDDIHFGADFSFENFIRSMSRNRLDIASPNVHGSVWPSMKLGLSTNPLFPELVDRNDSNSGFITNFAEIQLTAFSSESWSCFHRMLNPVLNPSGWFYDMCLWILCGNPRIGVLNFAVQHMGVGDTLPNGIPTTFTSFPGADEEKQWIDWANSKFSGKLSKGMESCRETSVNSHTERLRPKNKI